jgi:hypothetical protein
VEFFDSDFTSSNAGPSSTAGASQLSNGKTNNHHSVAKANSKNTDETLTPVMKTFILALFHYLSFI